MHVRNISIELQYMTVSAYNMKIGKKMTKKKDTKRDISYPEQRFILSGVASPVHSFDDRKEGRSPSVV
jgi:hypothetical protein